MNFKHHSSYFFLGGGGVNMPYKLSKKKLTNYLSTLKKIKYYLTELSLLVYVYYFILHEKSYGS